MYDCGMTSMFSRLLRCSDTKSRLVYVYMHIQTTPGKDCPAIMRPRPILAAWPVSLADCVKALRPSGAPGVRRNESAFSWRCDGLTIASSSTVNSPATPCDAWWADENRERRCGKRGRSKSGGVGSMLGDGASTPVILELR